MYRVKVFSNGRGLSLLTKKLNRTCLCNILKYMLLGKYIVIMSLQVHVSTIIFIRTLTVCETIALKK